MDKATIVAILQGTLEVDKQKEATAQLDEMHKIIGFAPMLMDVVLSPEVDLPLRQSGAVYLKNMVKNNWATSEPSTVPAPPSAFNIHEQDRVELRKKMVDGVVGSPKLVRQQFLACIKEIVRCDFPDRWPDIVDKVSVYLQTPGSHDMWYAALCCLNQLAVVYEYRDDERFGPMVEAMKLLLPLVQMRLTELVDSVEHTDVLLQKTALKVFHRYISRHMPLAQLSREVFTAWMELIRRIAERALPPAVLEADEDHRSTLVWCKCRKWALRLLQSTFERYGRPGRVAANCEEFAVWYVKAFTPGSMQVVMHLLQQHAAGTYVSPRVLQNCLDYLDTCVALSYTWKLLKTHVLAVIKDVVFPLLCFNDKDAILWEEDPYEFLRLKYDYSSDYLTPVAAASSLLESVTNKRKGVLKEMMAFVVQILTSADPNPCHVDGALHVVGIVNEKLLRKDTYKDKMEDMLVSHVFPLFTSTHGFLRSRACWLTGTLCELHYRSDDNLATAVRSLVACLLTDSQPPVQVESAVALASLVAQQTPRGPALVEPHLRDVFVRVLSVVSSTSHSELTEVLQQLVRCFHEQLQPMALQLGQHVLESFRSVASGLSGDGEGDEREEVVAGLLTTMDLLMDVWEEEEETTAQLEPLFVQAVVHVLQQRVCFVYEEALPLVTSLTAKRVSQSLWHVYELMYKIFEEDGDQYFEDMMPSLHNFITIGTDDMLSQPARLEALFTMCKTVLTSDSDQFQECHAVKLLECIILQCAGRIDQCLPSFVQVVVERMSREIDSDDLRVLCLQALIAVLYTKPQLLLDSFTSSQLPGSELSMMDHFMKQWLDDHEHFTGVHDRKMFVLGWCVLLSMPTRPEAVNRHLNRVLPILVTVLDSLKRAYQERAKEESDSESEDEIDVESLDEDEDELDEDSEQYLESLQKRLEAGAAAAGMEVTSKIVTNGNGTMGDDEAEHDENDDDDDEDDESVGDYVDNYEDYTTPLDDENCAVDEFVVFRQTVESLQQQQTQLYSAMVETLSADQRKLMQEVFTTAEQRRAAKQAEAIKKQGGYNFEQKTVPNSFNFGAGNTNFGGNC